MISIQNFIVLLVGKMYHCTTLKLWDFVYWGCGYDVLLSIVYCPMENCTSLRLWDGMIPDDISEPSWRATQLQVKPGSREGAYHHRQCPAFEVQTQQTHKNSHRAVVSKQSLGLVWSL